MVDEYLDELEKRITSSRSLLDDTTGFSRLREAWRSGSTSNVNALKVLADPNFLPSLLRVRHVPSASGYFFAPVAFAWIFLAVVQYAHHSSGSKETFFAWWSGQGYLGPWVFSSLVAFALLVAILLNRSANARVQEAVSLEGYIRNRAAIISAEVGNQLQAYDSCVALSDATGALSVAIDRIAGLTAVLGVTDDLLHRYETVATSASSSLSSLESVAVELGSNVSGLSAALGRVPVVFEGITSQLDQFRGLVVKAQESSQRFDECMNRTFKRWDSVVSEVLPTISKVSETAAQVADNNSAGLITISQLTKSLQSVAKEAHKQIEFAQSIIQDAVTALALVEDGTRRLGRPSS